MDKKENFLDKLYNQRVEEITSQIEKKWREEKSKINQEEQESKKISYYTQESYIQGFIDGVNLMINCMNKDA